MRGWGLYSSVKNNSQINCNLYNNLNRTTEINKAKIGQLKYNFSTVLVQYKDSPKTSLGQY